MSEEKSISVPAGAGPILSRRDILLRLAERCEREEPSLELSVRIFLALNDPDVLVIDDTAARFPRPHRHVKARSIWNDSWPNWGDRHQVEGIARELGCPDCASSLDAASTLSGWALAYASDIGADGLPLVVLTDGTSEAKGVAGRNLTLTWCAAALRARAGEMT